MPGETLTPEQEAIIHHPCGQHARVLAVAGSGKTTTMAHRIRYLVGEKEVNPNRIRVLMFNRLARKQFKEKLIEIGLPAHLQPEVHTFHSFSYKIIVEAMSSGLLPSMTFWVDDKEELVRQYVHRAIHNLVSRGEIQPDSVDVDECIEAIGLWKGSLIPPPRAGCRGNPFLELVYGEFERLRVQKSAVTYDDLVPLAVGILETEAGVAERWCNQAGFVIVDEYQDVNYGQQRLLELVAGNSADVMVVGDDDQTIYEWRGARPDYILHKFQSAFTNKPLIDYTLSHSFRFGPLIAQSAQNVIEFNHKRIPKPLIAHSIQKPANIQIVETSSEQPTDVDRELAHQIITLVRECGDPRKVIVLARMFSQLSGLEMQFLALGIPYRVVGRSAFFERREIRVLLDYVRLASILDSEVTQVAIDMLLSIANVPNRRLHRGNLERALHQTQRQGGSVRDALVYLSEDVETPLSRTQRDNVANLLAQLERLQERLTSEPQLLAGNLLKWLVESIDYLKHFDNYYGMGEHSEDRKRAVEMFCGYACSTGLNTHQFLKHVDGLDPTRGRPEEEQIVMTTVFRTKGLEYDYVVIPSCVEGYMPCHWASGSCVFDKAGIVEEPESSEVLENERRLFYVAITRARKGVLIGTSRKPLQGAERNSSSPLPSRFIYEMQLDVTSHLVTSLQQLVAGNQSARDDLLRNPKRFRHSKKVITNFAAQYLPGIDEALAREVAGVVTTMPEVQFEYPLPYGAITDTAQLKERFPYDAMPNIVQPNEPLRQEGTSQRWWEADIP